MKMVIGKKKCHEYSWYSLVDIHKSVSEELAFMSVIKYYMCFMKTMIMFIQPFIKYLLKTYKVLGIGEVKITYKDY